MAHHRGLRAGHEIQRDSPGTWEIQISPCGESKVAGDPAGERNPGAHGEAPPHGRVGKPRPMDEFHEQWKTQTDKKGKARYRGDSE